MSTQHPDNVHKPFFASSSVLGSEDEIKEAYHAFHHLGIKEQLWDFEGKETDAFVVKKLLMQYPDLFEGDKGKRLGRDYHLTYRVPNPDVERSDAKLLLETLESIPRSFDAMRHFYAHSYRAPDAFAPIQEVYLPMCTSAAQLSRIADYYRRFVAGKQHAKVHDTTVGEWIGDFKPESIRVTGLFENKEGILGAADIAQRYIKNQGVKDYQRVWFARSDPALNYGSIATVLLVKTGLARLHALQERSGVAILPIIGCGSAPFRGNLKPTNADDIMDGYPSVQTYTLQSAFKYDYPEHEVIDAVERINSRRRREPWPVDEKMALPLMRTLMAAYRSEIRLLAPWVNEFASQIPQRRKRKQHIGLFGYSREAGVEGKRSEKNMIHLPRAITFCASFYSWGLPPELLGLSTLTRRHLETLDPFYPNVRSDLGDALQYLNKHNLRYFPRPVVKRMEKTLELFDFSVDDVDERHRILTTQIPQMYKNKEFAAMRHLI